MSELTYYDPNEGWVPDEYEMEELLLAERKAEAQARMEADKLLMWGKLVPPNDLSEYVDKAVEHPIGSGGFGDVYKGSWMEFPSSRFVSREVRNFIDSMVQSTPVAIKVIHSIDPIDPRHHDTKRVSLLRSSIGCTHIAI